MCNGSYLTIEKALNTICVGYRTLPVMTPDIVFNPAISFDEKAIALFQFQAAQNPVYQRFLEAINCDPNKVRQLSQIPFLPISLFKTHAVQTGAYRPQVVFSSSGTTGTNTSYHYIPFVELYEQSFRTAFEHFYGPAQNYCVLGLLPNYLERSGSSLVYMSEKLIEWSGHPQSGFCLYDFERLDQTLRQLEAAGQPVLLLGVTYALLDFAERFPQPLRHTIVMETGGMKGRKKELLRSEVHGILKNAFHLEQIHSEYGMTELLSQAYAKHDGQFQTPHWMKAVLREEDDPFALHFETAKPATGALNIIDLANIHSCAFIATEDVARLHPSGQFEVLGRMDNTDIRGCSLLAI